MNYNGEDFGKEAYQYLYEAASENYNFNDNGSVFHDDARYFLSASYRVYRQFAMDMDQFILSCSWSGKRQNCSEVLSYLQEPITVCYETLFTPSTVSESFNMLFYFNSSKFLGKYTKSQGAYVVVSHPEEYKTFYQGIFIRPKDFSNLALRIVHKRQARSFEKAKCVHKHGLETYNFTGEPFDVIYSPKLCKDLCYVHVMWDLCNCVTGPGWNITKTECLEEAKNRHCVNDLTKYKQNTRRIEDCHAKCLGKCDRIEMEVSVFRENWKLNPDAVFSLLEELTKKNETHSPLAQRLLEQIAQSDDKVAAIVAISENIAQCNVYLMADQPITNINLIEMVTFSTLLSNIGGLLGMWLGLSAISVITSIQKCVKKIYLGFQMCHTNPQADEKRVAGTIQSRSESAEFAVDND